MKPEQFVLTYYPFAKLSAAKTQIPALAVMAQAALESGWGEAAPGNMLFGVKDTDGVNGNEQLVTTTEYSRRADLKFPLILSVTPVVMEGQKYFKYKVKDYFRKYDTPEQSFTDHADFFLKNKRYKSALLQTDPYRFIDEIAKAGYATAPNYAGTLKNIAKEIEQLIIKLKL